MATQSTICYENKDGTVTGSYCHYDGHPGHTGALLGIHYNTLEQVKALVALGSLSFLEASIKCPKGHTFETPIKGCTIANGRDRGEEDTGPEEYISIKQALRKGTGHIYIFTLDKGWKYFN